MSDNFSPRQFLPSLSELIDRLSVTQIKVNLLETDPEDFLNEIDKIKNDLDLIINEKKMQLNSELIISIVIISQLNLHIWRNKDEMQLNLNNEASYLALLKKAHQFNGYRNQIKNRILQMEGVQDKSQLRSNFETDGLNWRI
jgi:hypothetical protein